MVYAPQRRHAVASMSTTVQALALVQHLYAPNTLVLLSRVFSMIHIRAPAVIQPTRSLLSLFFLVTSTNVASVFFHLLGFAGGTSDMKGIMLDFVGQTNPASLTRVLLLDLAIFLLQLVTLIVCYVVNYSPTLPKSDIFPYDDLLLPPEAPARPISEADLDVESGDQFRQRRHGKGPRYHTVASDEPDMGEEEEGPRRSSSRHPLLSTAPIRSRRDVTSASIRRARSGVPLVFNIPLGYMLSLIFRLPGPSPMRVASGGTPFTTPPATPRVTRDDLVMLTAAVAQASAIRESQAREAAAGTRTSEDSSTEGRPRGSTDAPRRERSDDEDPGRIPGDYWTSRAGR